MLCRRAARCCVVLGVSAVCAMLAGCGSSTSNASIRSDVTPELRTLSQRQADVNNTQAIVENQDRRMLWEDLSRMWLYDRPSRLSPKPIPH